MAIPKPKIPKLKDTLISYLRVQENFDRKMYQMLRVAASDIEKDIIRMAGKNGIGAVIRGEQLRAVKKAIHLELAKVLRQEGFMIAAGYEEAAAAALGSMQAYELMLMKTILDDAKIQAYLRSAMNTSQFGIRAARQRMLGASYIPLSKQVYKTDVLVNGIVDRYVTSAIARGLNYKELAKGVRDLIRPDVPGGVSYASLRLGRTELNNAFHAVAAEKARKTPWITGVKWNLSGSHPEDDDCDVFANTSHYANWEPGVFKSEDIPAKPHPNCLCFTTPETVTEDEFLDAFFRGDYDSFIDDVIARDGLVLS